MAWIICDKEIELRGYDNIGIQYYYLGNKEKAKYYHRRMILGRGENIDGEKRMKCCEIFKKTNISYEISLKSNLNNDYFEERLCYIVKTYSEKEEDAEELHNVNYIKLQEGINNSFISEAEVSFNEASNLLIKETLKKKHH